MFGLLIRLRQLLAVAIAVLPAVGAAEQHGLKVLSIDEGRTRDLVWEAGRFCGSPRWSPDGEWVAYDTVLDRSQVAYLDNEAKVMVVRADGSDPVEIGPGGMPTWSPDGKSLAWHTYLPGGVVVAGFDPTGALAAEPEEIIDHWGSPVWLRDGRRIATIKGSEIALFDVATGVERIAYSGWHVESYSHGIKYGYSVSPDGKRVSYRTGADELIVASFDSTTWARRRLPSGKTGYSSWSPDGERLVVSHQPRGAERRLLYTLTPDGDDEPALVPGQEAEGSNLQPDWSPDGKSIVYRHYRPERDDEAAEGEGAAAR